MSNHDLKAKKIQIEALTNLVTEFIQSEVVIRYAENYDTSNPLALVKRQDLYDLIESGITIQTWVDGMVTDTDVPRKYEIDGVFYLFTSLIDGNTSEPTLNSTPEPAWSQVIENGSPAVGYQDSWDEITPFANGVIVEFFSSGQNRLYRSLQASNLNHSPSSSPLYWEEIGIMRGEYPDDQPYDEGDVALNPEDNILYQSNVSGNSFALDYELPGGTWQLIGGGASEIPTLQQVLEAGNISTQPLRLGNELGNITFNHDSENGRGFIRLIVGGEIVSEMLIQSEDEDTPGVVIDKRLGIQDAVLEDEAITLKQASDLSKDVRDVYKNDLINSRIQYTLSISVVNGQNFLTDNSLKNKQVISVVRSGSVIYTPGIAASDTNKTVIYDPVSGTLTFPDNLYTGEFVKVEYAENPQFYGLKVNGNDFISGSQNDRIKEALNFLSACGGGVLELSTDTITVPNTNIWVISESLILDSNVSLFLNYATLKMSTGIFDTIIRNKGIQVNPANPNGQALSLAKNSNIRILGSGINTAFIEGADTPYTAPNPVSGGAAVPWTGDYFGWRTISILLANVSEQEIGGISFSKTKCWGVSLEHGAERFNIHDLKFTTTVKNGDGVNIRSGSKKGIIQNISGDTSDDILAFTAIVNATPFPALPYVYPGQVGGFASSTLGDNIEDVEFKNITGSSIAHVVALITAGGGKIKNIRGSKAHDTGGKATVSTVSIYTGTAYGAPSVMGDIENIYINDILSTSANYALEIKIPFRNSAINFIKQLKSGAQASVVVPPYDTQQTNVLKTNIING